MLQFMTFCTILVRVKGIKRFKADGCFKDGDYGKKNKIFLSYYNFYDYIVIVYILENIIVIKVMHTKL